MILIHHDDVHSERMKFTQVFGTIKMSYWAKMGRPYVHVAALKKMCLCMFGIGCVGAFEITTRFQKYPSRTVPSSRRIASGMPSDTANPKGVKTPQHDKIRDES